MTIIPLTDLNRAEVDTFIKNEWGGPMMVTLGNLYDTSSLPGFAAFDGGRLSGAALYRVDGDACEIAALFSVIQNRGVGSALINRVLEAARGLGCVRVWLVTTNDNTGAIRFYQKFGFALVAVHIGSMEAARRLKKEIPSTGVDGIPIEHEFEFEITL